MIGSLLYLTTSRPDIMFSVCICAKFQFAKRIFKYLFETIDLRLWYPKNVEFKSVRYSHENFIGSLLDRKSTSETCQYLSVLVNCQFLGSSLVSWFSKKQNSVVYRP